MFRSTGSVMLALALATVLFTGVACDKKSDQNNGGQVAVTPLSQPTQACASGIVNQGSWNTQYSQWGVIPYGYGTPGYGYPPGVQTIQQQGYCGCPAGYQAMCDQSYGVTCVPAQYLGGQTIAWWQLGQGGGFAFQGYSGYAGYSNGYGTTYRTTGTLPPPPVYGGRRGSRRGPVIYQPQYQPQTQAQYQSSCSSQIGQTCTVGPNTCGGSAVCQPLAAGATIGVCVQ